MRTIAEALFIYGLAFKVLVLGIGWASSISEIRRKEPPIELEDTMALEPQWKVNPVTGDLECQHGVASDTHCCGCHSGFVFEGVQHEKGCVFD